MQTPVFIEPGCPWHELSLHHLPNIRWCEEILCSWVVNPANTWSNLAYVFVALWIILRARANGRKDILWLGYATFFMGVGSFLWHMSYTFVLQLLDFAGMFLFLILILLVRLSQMERLKAHAISWLWLAGSAMATALVAWAGFHNYPIQGSIVVLAVVGMALEIQILKHSGMRPRDAKFLWMSLVLAVVAVTLSALDVSGTLCDPTNHWIQGHAVWHVLTALAVGLWVRHVELLPSPFGKA
jgi:hypothetical protein